MLTYLTDAIAACEQALADGSKFALACQTLGNLLQGLGHFEEAVEWHTRSLHPQPNPVEIYTQLGTLYARQREWQRAIATFNQALHLQPNCTAAYWGLADSLAQSGQQADALDCWYQALTLDPNQATAEGHCSLGDLFWQRQQADKAIACYERAIQVDADCVSAYCSLGNVLAAQERYSAALEQYQLALKLAPTHAKANYGLGKLLERQGNWQGAIACYEQALAAAPQSFAALYALADLLLRQRQWEAGVAVCRRALELKSDFSWLHHNLGYGLLKQGQVTEAIAALRQALALNSDSVWTYFHLSDALVQQGQWEEAIAACLAAIQRQSELPGIYHRLGYALRQRFPRAVQPENLSNTAEVGQTYQRHLWSAETHSSEFWLRLGDALAQRQQFEGAIVLYQMVLSREPGHATASQSLEAAIQGKQQLDQQIAHYRWQIQHHPQLPWFYSQLGNVLTDQGEIEAAIALHRQAGILQGWTQMATQAYQFTRDWFTHHIPVWQTCLAMFADQPGLSVLEIGSYEGMSTCWFLDQLLTHPEDRITCIDLYFQDRFDINLYRSKAATKVIRLPGNSHDILPFLEANSYDLVYIDGCHLASHVQKDAELSWNLLKAGGVMIFDDYEWVDPNYPGQEPKLGIDRFLTTFQTQIKILHRAYQVVVQKASA